MLRTENAYSQLHKREGQVFSLPKLKLFDNGKSMFSLSMFSLSEKRKHTVENYEDEGIQYRRPKRLRFAKSSELNIVGRQSREENIRSKSSGNRPPKVDAGNQSPPER